MQPQEPQYKPQPHQSIGTPTHLSHPQENYTAPEFEHTGAQPQQDYSFITDPTITALPKQRFSFGGGPLLGKLVIGGVVLFVLFILFALIKSFTGSGPGFNTTALMGVIEDQQELIHLSTGLTQKPQGLATTTLNSSITVQLSITDAQTKLIHYLQTNKYKINVKLLNSKISPTLDTQLSTALAGGTFDQTYQTVIQNQLNAYCIDLKAAYASDNGANGRALLNADYNSAQLLLQQLNSPAS